VSSAELIASVSTASVASGTSRLVKAIGDDLAIAAGSSVHAHGRTDNWVLEAGRRAHSSAAAFNHESSAEPVTCSDLLNDQNGSNLRENRFAGPYFAVTLDNEIAWWSGSSEVATAAIICGDDEIYRLPETSGTEIRSESLRMDDTLVVVNQALVAAVPDLEFAIETALSGEIPTALGCAWLIELACGDGASSPVLAAVLRPSPA